MAYKSRFGSKRREQLYQREALAAHNAGRGPHPICVHCHLPVTPGQAWDEAHVGAPAALGGHDTGVGHRLCNHRDNNAVITPMVAKVKRVRRAHLGITGPGLGRYPMRAGVRSAVSKTMRHGVQPRLTLGEKLARYRGRYWFPASESAP